MRNWPKGLQSQALTVLHKENGKETADRVGHNADGSTDNGCMQVNNHAHFGTKGWTRYDDIYDADFNAKYALQIYKQRHNWSAWYSVCPLNHHDTFGHASCGR